MREPAIAAVALATVLVALPVSGARAHDAYDWIRRGGHLSTDGKPCCGKDDCTPLASAQVKQTPRGYALPEFGMVVPYAETLRSEDGKYWLCMTHSTRIRCFFAPPAAM